MRLSLALTSILLLAACAPKSADSDDGTGSTAAGTDGAEATSATGTPTTGDDPTAPPQMSAGTAPDPSTSTSTSTSTTNADTSVTNTVTTEVPDTSGETGADSPADACVAVCEHWDMCKPGVVGPVPACISDCVDGFGQDATCDAALVAQWDCVAGLACEEALKFIESSPTSCLNEVAAADEACPQLECGGEIGGDEMNCEFQHQCGDVTQTFVCDLEVCTCKEEGMPDKECPSNGFCMLAPPEQNAAINECCGWDWQISG